MRARSTTTVVLAIVLLGAACDTETSGTAMEVPPVVSASPVAPSPGQIRFTLVTHCGIRDAEVEGVLWKANPPLGNGNPPDGWGNPDTPGRWDQTSEDTAVFLADSGVAAAFVRAEPSYVPEGCA